MVVKIGVWECILEIKELIFFREVFVLLEVDDDFVFMIEFLVFYFNVEDMFKVMEVMDFCERDGIFVEVEVC